MTHLIMAVFKALYRSLWLGLKLHPTPHIVHTLFSSGVPMFSAGCQTHFVSRAA